MRLEVTLLVERFWVFDRSHRFPTHSLKFYWRLFHPSIVCEVVSWWHFYRISLVRCSGKTRDSLVLLSNKTPRSPTLSAACHGAAYRLTRSDLWGEWKTWVFPLGVAMDSLLRRYFTLKIYPTNNPYQFAFLISSIILVYGCFKHTNFKDFSFIMLFFSLWAQEGKGWMGLLELMKQMH